MLCIFPTKILFCCGILWFLFLGEIKSSDIESSPISSCEIERLLKSILSPPDDRTIQAQALRRRLVNLIRQGFDEQVDNELDEKGLEESKRNLQALVRDGYLRSSDEDSDDSGLKRSIQSLARMNQLPLPNEDLKRSISSLARNGELINNRREVDELLDELNFKRNIGSLARDFNFPSYGKRFLGALARNGDLGKRSIASIVRNGKRSLSSLARSNNLPEGYGEYKRNVESLARGGGKFVGKRNVAALLRQDSYANERNRHDDDDEATHSPEMEREEASESKRSLASVKAGYKPKIKRSIPYLGDFTLRSKREADYYEFPKEEYIPPMYQNQNNQYDEIIHALEEAYPSNEKRFLGSVARSGWPSSISKYRSPDKRHIGSLARLGWLPSFRSVRRFNRSGRSTNYEECPPCRETATDGEAEDDSYPQNAEDKRFLLIPAANRMFLRKFPIHSIHNSK